MDATPREGVEVHRKRRDERLALTGLHLGDPAEVQGHATHQLDVEVPLTEHAPRSLAHDCVGLDQQVVERLALGQPLFELQRLGLQLVIAERLHRRFEVVDGRDELSQATDLLALTGAQDFRENAHDLATLPAATGSPSAGALT